MDYAMTKGLSTRKRLIDYKIPNLSWKSPQFLNYIEAYVYIYDKYEHFPDF